MIYPLHTTIENFSESFFLTNYRIIKTNSQKMNKIIEKNVFLKKTFF